MSKNFQKKIIIILLINTITPFFFTPSFPKKLKKTLEMTNTETTFKTWQSKHKKTYLSPQEYLYRLSIFTKNNSLITSHNNSKTSYKLSHNFHSDKTFKEFSTLYLQKPFLNKKSGTYKSPKKLKDWDVPERVDWRLKNKVSPIRDQQTCGSCYSFSSNTTLESFYAINISPNEDVPVLSPQYMVNCGAEEYKGIMGCNGALDFENVFSFLKNKGSPLEKNLPYLSKVGVCRPVEIFAKVPDFKHVSGGVEDLLKAIVLNPVVLAIEVNPSVRFYSEGILDIMAPCGMFLNHAVTAVGYDISGVKPYVIIKNSWGTVYGEMGYFNYALHEKTEKGMCGMVNFATYYPVMKNESEDLEEKEI